MCTAHWEAITACFARLPPGVVAGIQDCATSLLSSLACLIGRAPLAVATDPELHSLFAKIWRQLPQASRHLVWVLSFNCLYWLPSVAAFLAWTPSACEKHATSTPE